MHSFKLNQRIKIFNVLILFDCLIIFIKKFLGGDSQIHTSKLGGVLLLCHNVSYFDLIHPTPNLCDIINERPLKYSEDLSGNAKLVFESGFDILFLDLITTSINIFLLAREEVVSEDHGVVVSVAGELDP